MTVVLARNPDHPKPERWQLGSPLEAEGCLHEQVGRARRTTDRVSAEHVRIFQLRVDMFRITHQLFPHGAAPPRGAVAQYRHHLAKWIVASSAAFDAGRSSLQLPLPAAQPSAGDSFIENSENIFEILQKF